MTSSIAKLMNKHAYTEMYIVSVFMAFFYVATSLRQSPATPLKE